tara:strand:+ start:14 stop:487 length:474 start_codon:yes stop_codon:yes gene_type:complete
MELAREIVRFILSEGKDTFHREIDMPSKRKQKFKFSSISKSGIFGGQKINFYPSNTKGKCQSIAVFISIKQSTLDFNSDPSNHKDFESVIKKMVQQVLGSCFDKNKEVIFITDEINTNVIEQWKPNFKAMRQICDSIQIVFIDGSGQNYNANHFFGI